MTNYLGVDVDESTEWFPIPGFDKYEISLHGEMRSCKTGVYRILKLGTDRYGYRRLTLSVEGKARYFTVHALMALTFIGPRPPGLVIRHLDGDQLNNVPENIRYGTSVENAQDRIKHGRDGRLRNTHCPEGHEFTPENTARYNDGARHCRTCMNAWAKEYREKNCDKVNEAERARHRTPEYQAWRKEYEASANRVASKRERDRIRQQTDARKEWRKQDYLKHREERLVKMREYHARRKSAAS